MMPKGPLSPEEAAEGIRVARENAKSLLRDAQLLFDQGRWPRAASLAILAMEEAAKPSILRGILVATREEDLERGWRDYRTHTAKNFMGELLAHARSFSRLEDWRPMMKDREAHRRVDDLKQSGFYSGLRSPTAWQAPEDVIDEALADALLFTARIAVESNEVMTRPEELRIWAKHLRPVQGKDVATMKSSVLACYEEAAALGLIRGSATPERMAEFLGL